MFRARRHRIVLFATTVCLLAVYHLSRVQHWDDGLLNIGQQQNRQQNQAPPVRYDDQSPPFRDAIAHEPVEYKQNVYSTTSRTQQLTSTKTTSSEFVRITPTQTNGNTIAPNQPPHAATPPSIGRIIDIPDQFGQGRSDIEEDGPPDERNHWESGPEHFPVLLEDLKVLPAGSLKQRNQIQYDFTKTDTESPDVLQKQQMIKEAFKHAWTGYADYALPHDELKPLALGNRDPFNGWGATLVDALDTLWIMGLQTEFEEALTYVEEIDFTTSGRKDIPIFETTIRYLGGLISAYDVSSGKYQVLLDKAVELANVLMGAFDTPNRMPSMYFRWAPEYTSKAQRSGPHTVLAELGSLSVEFTRLAQITKDNKFYDAVARITDALEEWQMKTSMPGLWPVRLDSSGCNKTSSKPTAKVPPNNVDTSKLTYLPVSSESDPFLAPPVKADRLKVGTTDNLKLDTIHKRQTDDVRALTVEKIAAPLVKIVEAADQTDFENSRTSNVKLATGCTFQGLAPEPRSVQHTYSIQAMADSTYEYLPKEHILLGGLSEQYRSMYLNAIKTIREKLLFRPMTLDNEDILFTGEAQIRTIGNNSGEIKMNYVASHLGCFAGGMFALGSRVFDISSDMEIAAKLTNGCVWAYESMPTGIMPEAFTLTPCDSMDSCTWNQTRYHELLDPQMAARIKAAQMWNEKQKAIALELSETTPPQSTPSPALTQSDNSTDAIASPRNQRRQVDYTAQAQTHTDSDLHETGSAGTVKPAPADAVKPSNTSPSPPAGHRKVVSHEDFVKNRILTERLPTGFVKITDREYKLRPEAIESVFIMYRLTGDPSWREKGWRMFESVQQHTQTPVANSAINDVTTLSPVLQDSMESFWLAETLKYFYLLFSDPDHLSLDDFVLNTEAHPFRLPR